MYLSFSAGGLHETWIVVELIALTTTEVGSPGTVIVVINQFQNQIIVVVCNNNKNDNEKKIMYNNDELLTIL